MASSTTHLPVLDQKFEQAVHDGVLAGGVAFARNSKGTLNYAKAFGRKSPAKGAEVVKLNTVMAIASATKLITTIAALQVVERGLVGLDDDVCEIVPLLAEQEVFDKAENEGIPPTKKRQNPITLRLLLTHSAGAGYSMMNPHITAWRKAHGLDISGGGTFEERIIQPMAFEPGTSWEYGTGIDWAGRVVEVLTGQSLEDHFKQHICKPLGIKDITFWINDYPEMKARLAKMTVRASPDGPVVDYDGPQITDGLKDCYGGHGGFADLSQYIEILQSILVDDERLLTKQSTAQMFKPQLASRGSRETLNREVGRPDTMFIGEFHPTNDYDWGLGGLLTGDGIPGWRGKTRLTWSGMPNIFWFIDRDAGFCGVFGTQVLPPGDKQIMRLLTTFERAIFEECTSLRKSNEKI